MIVSKRLASGTVLLLVVYLSVSSVYAGSVRLGASQSVAIAPVTGSACPRLLVKFDLPQELYGVEVDYAQVLLPMLVGQMQSRHLGIRAWSLSRDWVPGSTSWVYPWDTAGGDFSGQASPATIMRPGEVRNGAVIVVLDVTDIVQHWTDVPSANHGLAVSSTDPGSVTSTWETDGTNQDIVLKVFFTSRMKHR